MINSSESFRFILRFFGVFLPLFARADDSCRQKALDYLKETDSKAYKQVYIAARSQKIEKEFLKYIDCKEWDYGLTTAVHESVHHIDLLKGIFLQRDSQALAVPKILLREKTFFEPKEIEPLIEDPRVGYRDYLKDPTASAVSFRFLLDELNAYTYELGTAFQFRDLKTNRISLRDGVESMMYFLKLYLHKMKKDYQDQWTKLLKNKSLRSVIKTLWSNAEQELEKVCTVSNFGMNDSLLLPLVFQKEKHEALMDILGRSPELGPNCKALKPEPVQESSKVQILFKDGKLNSIELDGKSIQNQQELKKFLEENPGHGFLQEYLEKFPKNSKESRELQEH